MSLSDRNSTILLRMSDGSSWNAIAVRYVQMTQAIRTLEGMPSIARLILCSTLCKSGECGLQKGLAASHAIMNLYALQSRCESDL